MADSEFQGKPNKPFSFFNRSLTLNQSSTSAPSSPKPHNHHLHNPSSPSSSRFYNSLESMKGKVRKLRSLFEAPPKPPEKKPDLEPDTLSQSKLKSVKSMGPDYSRLLPYGFGFMGIRLPETEDRIVVYLTSLRGVRRTYEDCYTVRMIFRGFRVWVDERDISMDSSFRRELQGVLGEKNVTLPQVFIRGCYVGGVDVIKQMFETGELAKVLDGFPKRDPGVVCEGCGDARFVPCGNCSGSRKVFDEHNEVLKRCLECNENGLIRCPDCCF